MSTRRVGPCEIPSGALLQRHRVDGTFTDCYTTLLARQVALASYVAAFYTTPLFRLERLVLWLVRLPSTDADAHALARGERDSFAAWTVEARAEHELLLCDVLGRTRSWLRVQREGDATRLYFGSAVVPRRDPATGELQLGRSYELLLGFHRRYSIALLGAARKRLERKEQM